MTRSCRGSPRGSESRRRVQRRGRAARQPSTRAAAVRVVFVTSTHEHDGGCRSASPAPRWSGVPAASRPSNRPRLPSTSHAQIARRAQRRVAGASGWSVEEGVEVAPRPPARPSEPRGVDVVGPLLERAPRRGRARSGRAASPRRDERLAAVTRRGRRRRVAVWRCALGCVSMPVPITPCPDSRRGTPASTSCTRRRASDRSV